MSGKGKKGKRSGYRPPFARDNRNIVAHIDLEKPVRCYDTELEALDIEEPTGGHLEALDRGNGNVNRTNHLIARLADVPVQVIQRLGVSDYANVSKVVMDLCEPAMRLAEIDGVGTEEGGRDDDEDPSVTDGPPSDDASP